MTPDPKWLEILKASGWQTTGLALAFGVLLLLMRTGLVPEPDPLWVYLTALAFLICLFLALATIADGLAKAIQPGRRIKLWRTKRHEQHTVREFIPYMTDKDKEIIGYLLHHKQKMFNAEDSGGYAAPLIAKRIIRIVGVHGQMMDTLRVPFEIPDHIWTVLEEHADQFPYRPSQDGKTEPYPWAIPWMVR